VVLGAAGPEPVVVGPRAGGGAQRAERQPEQITIPLTDSARTSPTTGAKSALTCRSPVEVFDA